MISDHSTSSKRHKAHNADVLVPSSSSSNTHSISNVITIQRSSSHSSVIPLTFHSLTSVRTCVQSMLDDEDAARVLRVSRYTATNLLTGYSFRRRVFFAESAAHLRRLTSFCSHYSLLITRMRLARDFSDPLHDVVTGQSLLPSSVIDLSLWPLMSDWLEVTPWPSPVDEQKDREEVEAMMQDPPINHLDHLKLFFSPSSSIFRWDSGNAPSCFNHPLPPGVIPSGVRRLLFGSNFNQPLVVGSIPSSVTVLSFTGFNQPLGVAVLPPALTHLYLTGYHHPLVPGVFPSSLRQLWLSQSFNQPLVEGALPPGLTHLYLGIEFNHPLPVGMLPSSLTHLCLSRDYKRRLQPGSLPHGLLHLSMGEPYNHPLTGVLPTTLISLKLSDEFDRELRPNDLPSSLLFLYLGSVWQRPLGVGVLPSFLLVVSFSPTLETDLTTVVLPSTLQHLTLCRPHRVVEKPYHLVPPGTQIHWSPGLMG